MKRKPWYLAELMTDKHPDFLFLTYITVTGDAGYSVCQKAKRI
jgi:hypothetical protein